MQQYGWRVVKTLQYILFLRASAISFAKLTNRIHSSAPAQTTHTYTSDRMRIMFLFNLDNFLFHYVVTNDNTTNIL